MTVIRRSPFTDQQKSLIRDEILNDPAGLGYRSAEGALKPSPEIVAILARRQLYPNPNPQPDVPAPINKDYLFSLLLPHVGNFTDEALIRASELADAQDRAGLKMWATIALKRAWIPQDAYDQIMAHVTATQPDPNWRAQLPGKTRLEEVLGLEQGQDPGISAAEIDEILGRV